MCDRPFRVRSLPDLCPQSHALIGPRANLSKSIAHASFPGSEPAPVKRAPPSSPFHQREHPHGPATAAIAEPPPSRHAHPSPAAATHAPPFPRCVAIRLPTRSLVDELLSECLPQRDSPPVPE